MCQTPLFKEGVVVEITVQLGIWNVQTQQNGIVSCSQGGFNFATNVGERKSGLLMWQLYDKQAHRAVE
ncbi:6031_t:CDS:1, partial [Paraglomus brasilianum]